MENIDVQINLLNQSIGWLETYHGNNISEINRLKNFRRKLKTIKFAIEERCSAAAYGESQAGKSYLMDSLLSQIGKPFSVDFGKENRSLLMKLILVVEKMLNENRQEL